ncbi:sodium-dependent neutral amino acid transporter B(0)AT3-like isoform X1 [Hyla sarda]|uniref:sodium-dependent neutral amino acid transporter B(0)AT3-like isoform X1 n=1 Tax=Hyla sarda TaxID=327740 RepID=UPI0024C21C84|nr:sodium-dependent neutral amino acid transporter B(0)AT3-like isoform X1 [Hyla sarda]
MKTMGSTELSNNAKTQERPKWDNKVQYLLTCIGFAVGLGNVWRFPYLCQTYGGGAFLIPYGIALIFEGIPLFYLELAIGQRLRRGSIGVWNAISPYFGGVGVVSLLVSFLVGVYYNTIIAWILWYFFNSFQDPLPWSYCPTFNQTGDNEECAQSSTVSYFWYRKTLNITSTIKDNGDLQWWMVLSLAAAWGAVYLCTIRGIQSSGKAVYVTSTFPYVVLTIFLIRGFTLPGAIDGLQYLFTPDIAILMNPRVWLDAATQIFFSLSLGFGGLIAFSSYNPEQNDCEKDAVTIAVINSLSSLYASIPIFSILGFKAKTGFWQCLDRNIISLINEFDLSEMTITRENYEESFHMLNSTYPDRIFNLKMKECNLKEFLDQSASGTGLAFIVFTEAIIQMPGSQVWAILFFTMLFSLGLSSMFGNIEGVLTPLLDLEIFPKWIPIEAISGLICLISFAFSLIFTMGSGNYWLQIFDSFTGSLTLLVVVFFEVIAVTYVYGIDRFSEDIKWMTGRRPNIYWQATWRYISPLLMAAVFLSYIVIQFLTPLTYETWDPDYENFPMKKIEHYPTWVVVICVLLVAAPCMFIPSIALLHFLRKRFKKQDYPPGNQKK